MFKDMVVSCRQAKTNKRWTVAISAVVESLLLGILILVPLIYTEALPKTMLSAVLLAPAAPEAPAQLRPRKATQKAKIINLRTLMAPLKIPDKIYAGQVDEKAIYERTGGGSDEQAGLLSTIIGSSAPGPAAPTVATKRIPIGGSVEAASLLNKVTPEYPVIARTARISGTIELHAIIATDGSVKEVRYVSGPPLLMAAAMEAVKQWR